MAAAELQAPLLPVTSGSGPMDTALQGLFSLGVGASAVVKVNSGHSEQMGAPTPCPSPCNPAKLPCVLFLEVVACLLLFVPPWSEGYPFSRQMLLP